MDKAPNLSEEEVQYFYNLLYILERQTFYKGFNVQYIQTVKDKMVILNNKYKNKEYVPKPTEKNVLNFQGNENKSKRLLKHIRNSFAHGLIESRENDFYFLDVAPSNSHKENLEEYATMIGVIEKDVFYKMIEELLDRNKIVTPSA